MPRGQEVNTNGILVIHGWLFNRKQPIEHLTLVYNYLSTKEEVDISYGLDRPDVAHHIPGAGSCGFVWNIGLSPKFVGKINLSLWVTLETGDRICCFARTVHLRRPTHSRDGFLEPNLYRFLKIVTTRGFTALKEGRLPSSPAIWIRYLQRYYRQLQTPALATSHVIHPWQQLDLYQRWRATNRLTSTLQTLMKAASDRLQTTGVTISVVVPVYNCPEPLLREMIASVKGQIYPKWELCLADDASTASHVKAILTEAMASDSRIKCIFRNENGHIVATTNSALDLATGDYVAFLDHDDLLSPDALLQVAECIAQHPEVDWIYTDEDKVDERGRHYDSQFKGAWNPDMAITHNFTHHLRVIRRSVVEAVGRLRPGFEGAQDLDLILRVAEYTTSDRIRHIAKVCYHWRSHPKSTASHGTQKQYVFDSAYRAITEAVQRRGLAAEVYLTKLGQQYGLCLHQLRWSPDLLAQHGVTIVIPTKDKVSLLKECIASLEKTVNPQFVRLIIVDDNSQEPQTHKYLQQLEEQRVLRCRVVRPNPPLPTFNYSKLVNLGTAQVDTPYVLHLNNDIEAITPGWLEEMVGWLSVPGVAVVGAKLLYPNQRIQHAGVVVGPHHGLADHQFDQLHKDELGYLFLPHAARDVSAVTGACLLTHTALYQELGGFDETDFSVEYNDTNYCLRAIAAGYRAVFTPASTLIHHTSASRSNLAYNPTEHLNFVKNYRGQHDLFFNENLDIDSMTMAIDPYHFCHLDRAHDLKLKVLVISHNLNLEGATLIVYNYARYFATAGGYDLTVVSSQEGILREKYEQLGIPVQLIDPPLAQPKETIEQYRDRLRELGNRVKLSDYDLVVCNTIVTCWGVEMARLSNRPSLWHLHESTSIDRALFQFFSASSEVIMRSLLQESLVHANRVIFQANATRQIFNEFDTQDNFRTIPGGIDLESIAQFRRAFRKEDLRSKYDIGHDQTVIAIVGTTSERKGQHIFIEAIQRLEELYPYDSGTDFCYLIVGARESTDVDRTYLALLKDKIKKYKLKNIRVIKETPNVYEFFALSDIYVCASFEESFPRVLLEAMAFELKIVSTDVFGTSEILGNDDAGLLVEPGNPDAIANAILTYLKQPQLAERLTKNGYARVHRLFDNQVLLKQHLQLLQEAYLTYEQEAKAAP